MLDYFKDHSADVVKNGKRIKDLSNYAVFVISGLAEISKNKQHKKFAGEFYGKNWMPEARYSLLALLAFNKVSKTDGMNEKIIKKADITSSRYDIIHNKIKNKTLKIVIDRKDQIYIFRSCLNCEFIIPVHRNIQYKYRGSQTCNKLDGLCTLIRRYHGKQCCDSFRRRICDNQISRSDNTEFHDGNHAGQTHRRSS